MRSLSTYARAGDFSLSIPRPARAAEKLFRVVEKLVPIYRLCSVYTLYAKIARLSSRMQGRDRPHVGREGIAVSSRVREHERERERAR